MTDEKIILTPDEAISILKEGNYVHNFMQGGFALLGCDYSREDAIKALRDSFQIEIGGDTCKAMQHPLAVWASDDKVSFFEADMQKTLAMEKMKQGNQDGA